MYISDALAILPDESGLIIYLSSLDEYIRLVFISLVEWAANLILLLYGTFTQKLLCIINYN